MTEYLELLAAAHVFSQSISRPVQQVLVQRRSTAAAPCYALIYWEEQLTILLTVKYSALEYLQYMAGWQSIQEDERKIILL